MTSLPHMPMYWERFFADTELVMASDTQGFYALLLGKMWLNHGWLPADDSFIARLLRLDVRTWRSRHKAAILALLQAEIDPVIGPIYRQKRLVAELAKAADLIDKRKAQTAAAREKKAAKSAQAASVTARPNGSVTEHVTTGSNNQQRARAEPEPDTETSPKVEVSGSPLPPRAAPSQPAAPSPAVGGRSVASPAASLNAAATLTGPFVPSRPLPPRPAVRTDFLKAWDSGEIPRPSEADRAAFIAKYGIRPEQLDAVPDANAKPQEEQPSERQPRKPGDDDLDDFLRF